MTIEEAQTKLGLMVGIVIEIMEADERFSHDSKAQRSVVVIKKSWETLAEFLDDDYELSTLS